ncbi:MAG: outer membrane lipoprotein carrier protein LolA [Treponema sp.]|jgi:hypothetical protein|nr:outer membrane lipoprotein carrier protein LolA [Treponema sp.]
MICASGKSAFLCGLLFIFGFTPCLLNAQSSGDGVFRYPLGSQTEKAFLATCQKLSEHPLIRGSFDQEKIFGRYNRSLKSSGNFIIAAQLGMVWNTVKPFPSTLALGKDFLIQSRPGGQKNVLSAQGNETFLRMADVLNAVFSGNSRALVDNFKVFYQSAGNVWEIGLSPSDTAINAFAEKIIMKGDAAIRSIQIFEQNGDSIIYNLSNHSYPAQLDNHEKSLFTYP